MTGRDEADAAILLRVAAKTVVEARYAWRQAKDDEDSLRAVYRACLLASRASQRAADAWADNGRISSRLADDAKRLSAAADDFKARLVRAVVA